MPCRWIASATTATPATTAVSAATTAAATATAPLTPALAAQRIGADESTRGLHGIRLAGTAATAPASATLATAAGLPLTARALDESFVVGLLQRIGDRAVIGQFATRLAITLQRPLVVGLLQGIRNRAVFARLSALHALLLDRALVVSLLQGIRDAADVIALVLAVATIGPGLGSRAALWPRGPLRPRRPSLLHPAAFDRLAITPAPAAPPATRAACVPGLTGLWRLAVPRWRTGQPAQGTDVRFRQVDPDPAAQASWQHDAAIADANEAADGMADGFEQASHLAVATFGDHDAIPVVGTFAPAIFDRLEGSALAFDLDTLEQARTLIGIEHPQ